MSTCRLGLLFLLLWLSHPRYSSSLRGCILKPNLWTGAFLEAIARVIAKTNWHCLCLRNLTVMRENYKGYNLWRECSVAFRDIDDLNVTKEVHMNYNFPRVEYG